MPEKEAVLTPDAPLTALRGISDKRAALFEALGVRTLRELTQLYPRSYEMRGRVLPLAQAADRVCAAFCCTVTGEGKLIFLPKGKSALRSILSFPVRDGSADAVVRFYNCPYLKDKLTAGAQYRFYGTVRIADGGKIQLINPSAELWTAEQPLPAVVPVYPTRTGLSARVIRDAMDAALRVVYAPGATDALPLPLRERYGLASESYAMRAIHFPDSETALAAARRRVMFEELLLYALRLSARRRLQKSTVTEPMQNRDLQPFYASLPYTLTAAQQRAIDDFVCDMTEKPYPMLRILSGDVGSGKTVCAAAAAFLAMQNGRQVALMAPTELLAQQHAATLRRMFADIGLAPVLLTGAVPAKEKARIKAGLADGSCGFVVGTHALLTPDVHFARLGLVITDEQQRFGVVQRAALEQKAAGVHILMMSATPIPRTLQQLEHGQMDRSALDEMPPGRIPVSTHLLGEESRVKLYGYLGREAAAGHRAYVVCPAIDENDDALPQELTGGLLPAGIPLKTVTACAEELRATLPQVSVGILHGKMKPKEKEAAMQAFADGATQILVSTTVVEVGVDVPQATVMVIENAERFGLSQLHQLRGRVGRGRDKSYCFLLSAVKAGSASDASARLTALCREHNGARIAEEDLRLRGPGDFFSTVRANGFYPQSGALQFAIADPEKDLDVWHDAFAAANEIIKEDPLLASAPYRALADRLPPAGAAFL